MPAITGPITLAPAGSTSTNTHTAVPVPGQADEIAYQVTAAGGTGISYKLQGTLDGTNFFDLFSLPSDSDTGSIIIGPKTAGTYGNFVSQQHSRFCTGVRLVTTTNDTTYSAQLYISDSKN